MIAVHNDLRPDSSSYMMVMRVKIPTALFVTLITLCGCHAQGDRSAPPAVPSESERGAYLVNLLACGRCHTEGYLTGNRAAGPALAGSTIGIAYTPDRQGVQPGLVFAGNLTPDDATGLGTWSRTDIIRAMTSGVGRDGHQRLPVMPWPNYAALTQADLEAIAAYLQSLKPVSRAIPGRTSEGDPSRQRYVRFGVYRFEPGGGVDVRELP